MSSSSPPSTPVSRRSVADSQQDIAAGFLDVELPMEENLNQQFQSSSIPRIVTSPEMNSSSPAPFFGGRTDSSQRPTSGYRETLFASSSPHPIRTIHKRNIQGSSNLPPSITQAYMSEISSPLQYPIVSPFTSQSRQLSQLSERPGSVAPGTVDSFSGYQQSQISIPSTPTRRRGDVTSGRQFIRRTVGQHGQVDGEAPSSTSGLQSDPGEVKKVIWGTTIVIEGTVDMFRNFLLSYCPAHKAPIGAILSQGDREPFYPKLLNQLRERQILEMNLDCSNLNHFPGSRKLYNQLIRYPQEVIPLMDHTLSEFFTTLFPEVDLEGESFKVRPFNLPDRMVNMRQLNPADIDQLVTVKGLLIRTSTVIPDLIVAFFRCIICEHTMTVDVDRGKINEPSRCSREDCKQRNSMRLIHNRCVFANKQVWKLQETPDETPDGETPYTVAMMIYDDLVDVAKPGDRLEVTGIFKGVPVRPNPARRSIKSLFKTFLDVVHIKRTDKKRLAVDSTIINENEVTFDFEEGDKLEEHNNNDDDRIIEISHRPDVYELLANSI
ncbi:hypothetical protein HK096_007105, partial [Nowakowskiella sp. JEL0078]